LGAGEAGVGIGELVAMVGCYMLKPVLTATGFQRLKVLVTYDDFFPTFALTFNSRPDTMALEKHGLSHEEAMGRCYFMDSKGLVCASRDNLQAGAHTRPLFGST
jgi:hypothetical protein